MTLDQGPIQAEHCGVIIASAPAFTCCTIGAAGVDDRPSPSTRQEERTLMPPEVAYIGGTIALSASGSTASGAPTATSTASHTVDAGSTWCVGSHARSGTTRSAPRYRRRCRRAALGSVSHASQSITTPHSSAVYSNGAIIEAGAERNASVRR